MNILRAAGVFASVCVISLASSTTHVIAQQEIGVTTDSVTFGTTFPLTGVASPGVRSFYSGVNAYFTFLNENGGVFGRKVNLLIEDNRGTPQEAIGKSNKLISADNIFAFVSNAPDCTSQIAVTAALRLGSKGIPNLFVDCYPEAFDRETVDSEYNQALAASTSFYKSLSKSNQFKLLKFFLDNNYPTQRVAVIFQSDENKVAVEKLLNDPRVVCKSSFVVGIQGPIGCNSSSKPLQNGDVVIYSGGAFGLAQLMTSYSRSLNNLSLKYFVNEEAFNPTVLTFAGLPQSQWSSIHFVSSNHLLSEKSNPAVATLTSIAQRFAAGETIDQRFLDGVNTGYVISGVLASIGSNLTRERFLSAMVAYGSNFDVLGLSERSKDPSMRFMPTGGIVVRQGASGGQAISELISIDQGGVTIRPRKSNQITNRGLPELVQLLPDEKPSPTPSPMITPSKPSAAPITSPSADTGTKPSAEKTQVLELDGEEEEVFGNLEVRRDKNRFIIQISSNLQNESIQVRATKKGQKAIIFRVRTDEEGFVKFATSRPLSGFYITLLLKNEVLSSVKVN